MFKGYGKVNSILHEKLNLVSEMRNLSSNNLLKSQELNVIEKIKNKKKAESAYNVRNNFDEDLAEDYNLDDKEKSVQFNPDKSINEMHKEESNNQNTVSNFHKENSKASQVANDYENNKKHESKKAKKKKKSEADLANPLQLHVDHFPKPNYKTVKVRDQITDMPDEANSHSNLFLTQKNPEIDSAAAKKNLIKDLKSRHNISYISDISQVNHINFCAFEVKNPGHKEHFNNKIVQIEKEILKEINQINKDQANNYNAELEKTGNFFDLDKSKVFDFTKRNKSASNPYFYGRPTSKQNFKTNPGLIRGFLKNFKNNKLLLEFFKYKKEKDKRELFNLQSNDFSSSQIFLNANTNLNTDYIETYYIGKKVNGVVKNASLTQNDFYKKNEIEKMKKYFEMIKQQKIHEKDEFNHLNNLNQDLFINKEFIKEFNEYALKLANGELNSEQKPNFNEDLSNQYNNFICSKKLLEMNKNNLNQDLEANLNKIDKIDEISENNEHKSVLQNDPMDNLVTEIFHSNNSQKSNLSPTVDFAPGSPPSFQFKLHLKTKRKSDKDLNSYKIHEKYLEENFYEESIDEDETKKVMLQVNDSKIKRVGSFKKEKEKAFFRQITNCDEPHNTNPDYDRDSKFLYNFNIIGKNLKNKNVFKNLSNNLENQRITIDNDLNNEIPKRKRKSKIKSSLKDALESNKHLNLNQLKDLILNQNTNEKNLISNNNTNRNIKTFTNENPTEILPSGLSYEDNDKIPKQEHAEGLFENEDYNANVNYEDYYPKHLEHKAISPPSFLRSNFQGKNSSNSIYENLQNKNKNNNKIQISLVNSKQNDYYKPISDKVSKNSFRNIQKIKFNRLKDIVFGTGNDEHKQKMIIDNIPNLNNISSNANRIYNKKPTTAPVIKKSKSPLRSLINNQMGLIIKNHNIY